MVNRENKKILSKFISRQIEAIYDKYKKITRDEEALVGRFIEKLEVVEYFDEEDLGTAYLDKYDCEVTKLNRKRSR